MSVVVAIKEEGKVYIGADSQVTKGGTRTTLKNPNNYKIWKVDGCENCLMGHVGNLRDANIVRLMRNVVDDYDEFYERVNYRYVVKYLVPEIIKSLKEAKFLKGADDYLDFMDSSYLFAYKDKLFCINTDCSVIEIDDYVAIGSGSQEAIGSLLSTEGQNPRKRIVKAIKASAASDIYVDYPIILTDTGEMNFEVVTEKNENKYLGNTKGGDKS
ncbi:MAG: hypothetical protein K5925_02080 [Bacilli bacterium]|nr:hypothetical protein [Bacilli bacterium]